LIPHVYNTQRIIRVLGEDGSEQTVPINQEFEQEIDGETIIKLHDLTAGKYDLTVTSGPSFTTKRAEASYEMTEFVRAFPAAAPVMGDLIAKNSDWPQSEEVAERLMSLLPPQVANNIPEEVQLALQEGQQAATELEALKEEKSLEVRKLEIEEFKAQTDRLKVTADIAARADEQDRTTDQP
jgi:hypothetical protein